MRFGSKAQLFCCCPREMPAKQALGPAGLTIRKYARGGSYLGFLQRALQARRTTARQPWPFVPGRGRLQKQNISLDFGPFAGPDQSGERFSRDGLPCPSGGLAVSRRFRPGGWPFLRNAAGRTRISGWPTFPLRACLKEVLARWRKCHGLNMDYLERQPLVVGGNFGRGKYVLSYSHLDAK